MQQRAWGRELLGYRWSLFPHQCFDHSDVAHHVYTCTRPSRPARKNWSAFYNGTWFTWFNETITATCMVSIENAISPQRRWRAASNTSKNIPRRFCKSHNNSEEKYIDIKKRATTQGKNIIFVISNFRVFRQKLIAHSWIFSLILREAYYLH